MDPILEKLNDTTPNDVVLIRTKDIYQEYKDKNLDGYSESALAIVAQCTNAGIPQEYNALSMTGKSKRGTIAMQLFLNIVPPAENTAASAESAAGVPAAAGVPSADAPTAAINPADLLNSVIADSGFRAHGCIAMIACASTAASLVKGKTLAEALQVTVDEIKDKVGAVPDEKIFTFYIALESIRAAVGDFLARQGASAAVIKKETSCSDMQMGCWMCEDCSLRIQLAEMIAHSVPQPKVYA